MSTILDMDVTTVPLERVTPYPGNARQGDITAIADSLAVNGQYRPLVVQRSTGHVLCGNNTLAAAHTLGWTEIAVQYIDVNDDRARRILLADNRTNDAATYDDQLLAELLTDLEDLDGTGYAEEEVDDLLAQLEEEAPEPLDPTPTPPGTVPAPQNANQAPPDTPEPPPPSNTTPSLTLMEMRRNYEVNDRRSVLLFYNGADYVWIVEQLARLAREHGTANNADTVAALIAHATRTTRPSQDNNPPQEDQ